MLKGSNVLERFANRPTKHFTTTTKLMHQSFRLRIRPEQLAICTLSADEPIPAWVSGEFVSITRTETELSIVCPEQIVPPGLKVSNAWRCLEIEGPLDLQMVGVLAALSNTLADADVSLFAISTFETDYLLIRDAQLFNAVSALRAAGHDLP